MIANADLLRDFIPPEVRDTCIISAEGNEFMGVEAFLRSLPKNAIIVQITNWNRGSRFHCKIDELKTLN